MVKYLALSLAIVFGVALLTYAGTPFPPYAKDSNAHLDPRTNVICFTSTAGSGGAATEALTATGVKASDSVVSASQSTAGANSVALIGYSTVVADGVTGIWSQDPGAGAVVEFCVGR